MKTYAITIAVGLGDAIFIAAALHGIKDRYDKICVNVRWDIAETYRGREYFDFYRTILKLVFNDPKFELDNPEKKYIFRDMNSIITDGIPAKLPRFANVFKSNNPIPVGEYLVLTTKVRQLDKKIYNSLKPQFFNTLNELSKRYPIYIIGEREIEFNQEYNSYGNRFIYSIYKDIKDNLKTFTDLTVPKLGLTVPNIENLKKDCSIMAGAKCVITLGCGGNFVLALAVSNRMAGLRVDDYSFVDKVVVGADNINITKDPPHFIKLLERLLK